MGVQSSICLTMAIGLLGAVSTSIAHAQDETTRGDEALSPNVSVLDRFGRRQSPLGVDIGPGTLFPSLTTGVTYNSNVFAAPDDADQDAIFFTALNADYRTDWGRHSLGASTNIRRFDYPSLSSESRTEYSFSGNGRYDISREWSVSASTSLADLREPRGDPQTAAFVEEPIEFKILDTSLEVRRGGNNTEVAAGVDFRFEDYKNGRSTADGSIVEQEFRDASVMTGYVRSGFRIGPGVAFVGEVRNTQTRYDDERSDIGVKLDSNARTASIGMEFDIDKVARGEIFLGYQERDYLADIFEDVGGLQANASVEYFPSGLTTFRLDVDRSLIDSTIFEGSAIDRTGYRGTIDHEILRPLVVSGYAFLETFDYDTLDRRDTARGFGAQLQYIVRRRTVLELRGQYSELESSGVSSRPGFDAVELYVGMRVAL